MLKSKHISCWILIKSKQTTVETEVPTVTLLYIILLFWKVIYCDADGLEVEVVPWSPWDVVFRHLWDVIVGITTTCIFWWTTTCEDTSSLAVGLVPLGWRRVATCQNMRFLCEECAIGIWFDICFHLTWSFTSSVFFYLLFELPLP